MIVSFVHWMLNDFNCIPKIKKRKLKIIKGGAILLIHFTELSKFDDNSYIAITLYDSEKKNSNDLATQS